MLTSEAKLEWEMMFCVVILVSINVCNRRRKEEKLNPRLGIE